MRNIILFFVAALTAATVTLAATPSGMWGSRGITGQFATHGNLLYTADGRGISVYDATSPASIRLIGTTLSSDETLGLSFLQDGTLAVLTRSSLDRYLLNTDGTVSLTTTVPASGSSLLASGNHLLANGGTAGVMLWDYSGGELQPAGTYSFRHPVLALAFRGDTLFASVDTEGVYVLDPSRDPASPSGFLPENARDLTVSGNSLVLAGGVGGLIIANIDDPFSPRTISRTGAGTLDLQRVTVSGTHAWVSELPDTLYSFDISNLAQPVQTSKTTTPAAVLLASGDRVFTGGELVDRFGFTNGTGVALSVLQLGNNSQTTILGEAHQLPGPVSGVATDGTLAYVSDPPFFRVIDVSRTAMPREIASIEIDGLEDHLKLNGTRVIAYGRGDVDIIDVSNPYAPKFVSVWHSFGRPPSNAAFARDTILEGNPWSGFHVIDTSNPTNPVQISGIKGHYYEVVAKNDVAYPFEQTDMRVVDLSTRTNANPLSFIPVGVVQAEIANGTGNHADLLLVSADDGLHVYDLSNPLQPLQRSLVHVAPGSVFGSSGETAYVTANTSLLKLDLTNPLALGTSSTDMHVLSPMQIASAQGKVVVADRYSLRVYGPDTAAPPAPPVEAPARGRAARH